MSKVRYRYNKELLNSCIERDGAVLVGEYENLNRDYNIKFICRCGKEGEKGFRRINLNAGSFCVECSNLKKTEKTKKTNLKKYGSACTLNNKEINQKVKATNIKRRGVEYPTQSKEVRDKVKATNLKKLGVEYPTQSKEVRDKVKATNLEKIGFEYPTQCKEVRDKGKDTNLKKLGVEHPMYSDEIKNKLKEVFIKKYGVDNPSKCIEIQEKKKETSLLHYGVENPMQHSEVLEKSFKNAHRLKDYKLPSGKIIKVQGYEPFALDKVLNELQIKEECIFSDRKDVPEIWWTDYNNKKRRYFTDIFIPSKKLIIEVKSVWTMKVDKEEIKLKFQRSKELGYNTLLWVFDKKGNIVKEYDNCPIEV
jgi:hypothetical protein